MVRQKQPQLVGQFRVRGNQFVFVARPSIRHIVKIIGNRAFQSLLVFDCLRIIQRIHPP